jgi:hypothetical protein
MILVTPKAGAKQELLLNKPASAVLTNSKHQHHLTECHVVDSSKIWRMQKLIKKMQTLHFQLYKNC